MGWSLLLLCAAGLAAGVAAGLGVGGGAILIPILTIFMGMEQKAAQGINLLYFIPTAGIAVITHMRNKKINGSLVKGLILYGIVGTVAGAWIATHIDGGVLRRLFGFFLLAVGLLELFGKDKANAK